VACLFGSGFDGEMECAACGQGEGGSGTHKAPTGSTIEAFANRPASAFLFLAASLAAFLLLLPALADARALAGFIVICLIGCCIWGQS